MPRGKAKSRNPELYQNQGAERVKQLRQLSAKQAELEDWENRLAKREDMFQNAAGSAEVKLKTLEGKIQARTEELEALDKKLTVRKEAVAHDLDRLNQESERISTRREELRGNMESAEASLQALKDKSKKTDSDLRKMLTEIQQRKLYQNEQEELIEQALGAGNDKLREVNAQIKRFETEREEVLLKIQEGNGRITHVEQQIEDKEQDMVRLTERYQDVAAEYRQELVDLKMQIAEAQTSRDKVMAETDAKLLELRAERAELDIKLEVIQKQMEEVAAEKRRIQSLAVQYGIQ